MSIDVIRKQMMLNAAGFNCGAVDGIAGMLFKSAVRKYQSKNGLVVDGIAGKNTTNSLYKTWTKCNKLSEHFAKNEFRCPKYCSGYPATIDPALIHYLEILRYRIGKPIVITSGLRCRKYNASLTGSISNSYHILGRAADISISGVTMSSSGKNRVMSIWRQICGGYTYTNNSNMRYAVHVQI